MMRTTAQTNLQPSSIYKKPGMVSSYHSCSNLTYRPWPRLTVLASQKKLKHSASSPPQLQSAHGSSSLRPKEPGSSPALAGTPNQTTAS